MPLPCGMRNHWELKDRSAMRNALIRCPPWLSLVSGDCAILPRKDSSELEVRRIALSHTLHLGTYHDKEVLTSPWSVYEPLTARRVYVTIFHDGIRWWCTRLNLGMNERGHSTVYVRQMLTSPRECELTGWPRDWMSDIVSSWAARRRKYGHRVSWITFALSLTVVTQLTL